MYSEIRKDKLYYALLVFVITVSTILNYEANLMSGVLPYYKNFSNYFANWFNFTEPFINEIYSYPMWGYGLILLLGNKLTIIIFQQFFTFITIVLLRKHLVNLISPFKFKILNILILVSFPWFFFQTSLWPYSISANLLTLSILYLSIGLEKKKITNIIISAIFYGLMLNFRSDYFYLIFIIFILIISHSFIIKDRKKIFFIFIWLTIIISSLLPWFSYTKKYTNHGSFVSSNSGHVLFISLGQLPNNLWQITTSDGDSLMYSIVRKKISKRESSLSTKSDQILKKEFIELISKNPKEFLRKCSHNLIGFFIQPFYVGDSHINKKKSLGFNEIKKNIKSNNLNKSILLIIKYWEYSYLISLCLYLIGVFVLFLFLFCSLYFIRRNLSINIHKYFSFLILIVFIYQLSLNTLAYSLPIYSTNIFLLCIVFISLNLNNTNTYNHISKSFRNSNY